MGNTRSFRGASLKHLKYYVVISPIDDTPDGCNNLNNKNSTPEKIANEIGDMAILWLRC